MYYFVFMYCTQFLCNLHVADVIPVTHRSLIVCAANSTQIDDDLFLDRWQLNFTAFYVDVLVLILIMAILRSCTILPIIYKKKLQKSKI